MGVCIGRLPEFRTLGLVGLRFRVPLKGGEGGFYSEFIGLYREIAQTMENQMEKNMEHELEKRRT